MKPPPTFHFTTALRRLDRTSGPGSLGVPRD